MSRSAALLVKAVAAIALLAAIVLAGHTSQIQYHNRLQIEWANVLHLPVFAALCALVWWIIPERFLSGWRRLVTSFVITAAIGLLGEIVQRFGSRDADPHDLLRDLAGAGVACLLIAAWPTTLARRIAALAVALVLVATACYPLISWIDVLRQRDTQVPQLATFDDDWELLLWQARWARLTLAEPPPEWTSARGRVAKLDMRTTEFPGMSSLEIHPNWSHHETLVIDFYNPGEPLKLSLRVHDQAHNQHYEDRFNTMVRLPGGPTQARIPLARIHDAPEGRTMDMAHIKGLVMYSYRLARPATVYVDSIHLE
jgi:VanZ family protein